MPQRCPASTPSSSQGYPRIDTVARRTGPDAGPDAPDLTRRTRRAAGWSRHLARIRSPGSHLSARPEARPPRWSRTTSPDLGDPGRVCARGRACVRATEWSCTTSPGFEDPGSQLVRGGGCVCRATEWSCTTSPGFGNPGRVSRGGIECRGRSRRGSPEAGDRRDQGNRTLRSRFVRTASPLGELVPLKYVERSPGVAPGYAWVAITCLR